MRRSLSRLSVNNCVRRFPSTVIVALGLLLVGIGFAAAQGFERGHEAVKRGDYATAFREWKPLAEQGHLKAQHNLALLYANGDGVAQDFVEAARWMQKAANQGSAKSQHNLGLMFERGDGVTKSFKDAAAWYLKAAEQGYQKSQYNLGRLYAIGNGVSQNFAEAARWWHASAKQGFAPAQTGLGIMNERGDGEAADYIAAYSWYHMASEQGSEKAKVLKNELRKKMTPQEVEKAAQITALNNWDICVKAIRTSSGDWDVRPNWKYFSDEAKRRDLSCDERKDAVLKGRKTEPQSLATAEEVALSAPFDEALVPQMNDLMLCVQGKFRKNDVLSAEISKRGIRCDKLLELMR